MPETDFQPVNRLTGYLA